MNEFKNRVIFGDCRDVMRKMISDGVRVQMVCSSPPYWGLRDYGVTGQIGLERTPNCGRHGLMKLRADLTEDQRRYVVLRLLGVAAPCAANGGTHGKE